MKVLSIDSTAGVAAVALTENGKVLADYTLNSGNTHSTTLLPMIESVLKSLSLTVSDIGLFAISAGPGSFTGVRIGTATVKGLAYQNNTPCIGVSSLEAMAENFRGIDSVICPVINARRNTVYCALFRSENGEITRLTDDETLDVSKLCDILSNFKNEKIYLTGDGTDVVTSYDGTFANAVPPVLLQNQNAVGTAFLGERKYLEATEDEKAFMNFATLSPIYLKKPQAEREREEKMKN